MVVDTKQCPYCGETIKAIAQKCKFCGEWLNKDEKKEQDTNEAPNTKQCPVCGEEILTIAKKCKHCGEILDSFYYKRQENSNYNFIAHRISSMQKVSNILWIVFSGLMILGGIILFCNCDDYYFKQGAGMETWECIVRGIFLFILAIYNFANIPHEFPEKILKLHWDIPQYYEGLSNLIIALVFNLIFAPIGVILIGFDLYIRKVVLDNRSIFTKT